MVTQRWMEEIRDRFAEKVDRLSEETVKWGESMTEMSIRIDADQKSATQLVNLALALLAIVTVTVIVSSVLK